MSRPWPERYDDAIQCLKETAIELGDVNLELKQVEAERDRLRKALHNISVASLSSMSNRGELGRIARAALKEAGE